MTKVFASSGMEIKLGRTMVCELTGKVMERDEIIIVSPKRKKILAIPVVSPCGTFFLHLTIVPFRPKKDVALYEEKKKAMGLLTNISL